MKIVVAKTPQENRLVFTPKMPMFVAGSAHHSSTVVEVGTTWMHTGVWGWNSSSFRVFNVRTPSSVGNFRICFATGEGR